MSGILKYKGYEGTVEIDMTLGICRGHVLFVKDLVTYEAESPKALQAEFEAAIEDYLETCKALGRSPQKPANGIFSVRVDPKTHMDAIRRSIQDGVTLNAVVVSALKCYLHGKNEVNNHYTVIAHDALGEVLTQTTAPAIVTAPYGKESMPKKLTDKVWN